MRGLHIKLFTLLLAVVQSSTWLRAQEKPPEIPSSMRASSSVADWGTPQITFLFVESRQPNDPDTAEDLERIRLRTLKVLSELSFPVTDEKEKSQREVTMLVAPHVRYGMFHYQNAPYVYLLVRERSSGQLTYCAYQRASHFKSATSKLLTDWKDTVKRRDLTPSGSLADCAGQAMRPFDAPDSKLVPKF